MTAGQHDEYDANACRPDALNVVLGDDGLANGKEYQHDTHEEYDGEVPHVDEVVEVLVGLHEDETLVVVGIAVLQQQVDQIGHEEDEEGHGGTDESYAGATADILVVHIINNI